MGTVSRLAFLILPAVTMVQTAAAFHPVEEPLRLEFGSYPGAEPAGVRGWWERIPWRATIECDAIRPALADQEMGRAPRLLVAAEAQEEWVGLPQGPRATSVSAAPEECPLGSRRAVEGSVVVDLTGSIAAGATSRILLRASLQWPTHEPFTAENGTTVRVWHRGEIDAWPHDYMHAAMPGDDVTVNISVRNRSNGPVIAWIDSVRSNSWDLTVERLAIRLPEPTTVGSRVAGAVTDEAMLPLRLQAAEDEAMAAKPEALRTNLRASLWIVVLASSETGGADDRPSLSADYAQLDFTVVYTDDTPDLADLPGPGAIAVLAALLTGAAGARRSKASARKAK